jgi:hypothetical protein
MKDGGAASFAVSTGEKSSFGEEALRGRQDMRKILPIVVLAVALGRATGAAEWFVAQQDPLADDRNPGTDSKPFKIATSTTSTARPSSAPAAWAWSGGAISTVADMPWAAGTARPALSRTA